MASFNRSIQPASILLLGLAISASVASAREWTNETGNKRITADFVELDGEIVRLKLPDGKIAQLPLYRLSEQDQEFVAQENRRRLGDAVTLSAAQQKLLADIVEHVRLAAKEFKNPSPEEIQEAARGPLTDAVILHSAKLVKEFGSRRVLGAVVGALVEDPDPMVRMAGLAAAHQIGENAVSATPQVMNHVDDLHESVSTHAQMLLSNWDHHGQAMLPACLTAMESNSLKRAECAREIISRLQEVPRVQWDSAAVRLSRVVLDKQKPEKVRIVVAQVVSHMFGLASNPDYQESFSPLPQLQEFITLPIVKNRHEKLLRELMTQLDNAHILICSAILEMLLQQQPELLAEVLPATVARMISDSVDFSDRDDEDFNRWGFSTPASWGTHHPGAGLKLPTDDLIKFLKSPNSFVRDFASTRARLMVRELAAQPEFLKLMQDRDSEIRVMIVDILGTPGDNSFDTLPQLKVTATADAAGKLAKLSVADEAVAKLDGLAAAIKRHVPAPKEKNADPELLLKKATDDSDERVREQAIVALARRRSPGAETILRQLAQDSLREDVRQVAQNCVRELTYLRNDRDPELSGEAKKVEEVVSPFVVELTIDPNLQMTELITLLGTLQQSVMHGIRWVAVDAAGKPASTIELLPNKRSFGDGNSPLAQFQIGSVEQGLRMRMPGGPMLRVPDLTAARFYMTGLLYRRWTASPYDNHDERSPRPAGLAPSLDGFQGEVVLLTATPEARCDFGRQALEALIYDPEKQLGSADLVRSITWFQGGQILSSWYVRAVK